MMPSQTGPSADNMKQVSKADGMHQRRETDSRHRTNNKGSGADVKPKGNAALAATDESTSNSQHSGEKPKKDKTKKPRRLISPKMIFLKRRLKHMYSDMAADKKAACGKITCKNIKVFVVIYALLFMIRGSFRQYFSSILEHIQRHFTLSMSELEFLVGVEKIGFVIIIIFSGYYGNKMHKPVSILIGALFCACGVILCSVPYFIEMSTEPRNITEATLYYKAGLCQIGTNESTTSKTQCEAFVHHPDATQAFSIIATGNFLVGIGSAFLIALGFIYIEETAPKDTAPLYYGIILCMNGVGETFGLISAWQFTKFPYTLSGYLELEDWSIGAWWLALPIIAALFLLSPFPLLLFPKWISEPKWIVNRRSRQLKNWLGLIKAEERLINKINRRQKRKKRKDEISKRKKERAKLEAETAEAASEATAADTESLDGLKQAGAQSNRDTSNNDSGINTENDDVIVINGDVPNPTGDVIADSIDVQIHSGLENGSAREVNDNIGDNSCDESDCEETSSGRSSPQTQDSQEIPTDSELKLHELGATELADKADAAPRRGVRFATDGAGDILIEVGMEVDDVLQMEEPAKQHDHEEESDSKKSDKSEKEQRRRMLGRRIQDLPKNIWFLMNRPVFSLMLTGTILAAYSPAGYQATLPAYIASQLPMNNPPGIVVAGVPYTIGVSVGALVAGCVMYKRDWKLITHVKIIMVLQCTVVILFLIAIVPHCDINYFFNEPIQNNTTVRTDITCSSRCDCRDAQFAPICSQDGVVFPSSCMGACRRARHDGFNNMVYDDCLCLPEVEFSSGFCNNNCYADTAGYGILVFLISSCQSFGQVSLLIICLRCISQKLRSLALGFAICMVLLAAYVPGVAVFRYFMGVACMEKQEDCLGDEICWSYDSNTYRYLQHGGAAAFQLLSVVFYLATFFAIRAKAKAMSKATSESQRSEVMNSTDQSVTDREASEMSRITDANGHPSVSESSEMTSAGEDNRAFEDINL